MSSMPGGRAIPAIPIDSPGTPDAAATALDGRTPAEAYRGKPPVDTMDKPLSALPTSPQAQQQQQEDRFEGILAA